MTIEGDIRDIEAALRDAEKSLRELVAIVEGKPGAPDGTHCGADRIYWAKWAVADIRLGVRSLKKTLKAMEL